MPDLTSNFVNSTNSGNTSTQPFITHFQTRNPTAQDVNFQIQQVWINTNTDEQWVLDSFSSLGGVVTAVWSKTGSGILTVEALQGNTGGPVNPDASHIIHTIGAAPYTVSGNPATSTLTWSDNGGIAYTYTEDVGTATPVANNLNIFGVPAQGTTTKGVGDTVTIAALDATTTQKGVSRLATNAEAISGSLTTNVVINPDDLKAKLGAQTTNGIAFGESQTSPVGWTAGLTDGQLAIGSSVGVPAAGNITSTGGSIIVTNGNNTINLETSASISGTVVQYVIVTDGGAYFATATTAAVNNTAPSNTDGAPFMNISIVPKSAVNRLVVRFQTCAFINVVNSNGQISWLLRDSGTASIATRVAAGDTGDFLQHVIVYETVAGSTASTTFFIRVAAQSGGGGTLEINGFSGSPIFNLTCLSTLEIWEITP